MLPGLFGSHGEVVVIGGGAAVAPGGVDVVVCAVQGGHGPDVGVVGEGCAVDALQLQQQVAPKLLSQPDLVELLIHRWLGDNVQYGAV